MIQGYENLLTDKRLDSIIGDNESACTLQIWILRIKTKTNIDNKFLYGRVTSGTFKSDKWAAANLDEFSPINDDVSVGVLPVNLYTSASNMRALLADIGNGMTLGGLSSKHELKMDARLHKRISSFSFGLDFIVRPVMHLPGRDYFRSFVKRLSPTSLASVNSAAISSSRKSSLFDIRDKNSRLIAKLACEALKSDTGMDFSTLDTWRLGDLELIVAPSLTRNESKKYVFQTKGDITTFTLSERLTYTPCRLVITIRAWSDNCLLSTHSSTIKKECEYPHTEKFYISEFKHRIATAYTLEVHAETEDSSEIYPCINIGGHYFRQMNLTMNVVENLRVKINTDWLSKQVPIQELGRVSQATQINRSSAKSHSKIGDSNTDLWVDINHSAENTISGCIPKKSQGRFFPKLSDRVVSRLDLAEWLRKIFDLFPNTQIAWIDPFMEDVGIDLLNTLGSNAGDYLVITGNLPKPPRPAFAKRAKNLLRPANKGSEAFLSQSKRKKILQDKTRPTRLKVMIQQCKLWSDNFGSIRLRVLSLPSEKLHDRMILIRSQTGEPIAGFHLSNSIQRANENHPLLITPIPLDVLPDTFNYLDNIIQSSLHVDTSPDKATILYDSTTQQSKQVKTAELRYLTPYDSLRSGDVMAWWFDLPELAGLHGDNLQDKLIARELLNDEGLDKKHFSSLPSKFWTDGLPLEDFDSAWNSIGYFLANSQAGQIYENEQPPIPQKISEQLIAYLDPGRSDATPPPHRGRAIEIEHYLAENFFSLLTSRQDPSRLFFDSLPEVAWGDFYAIKILWLRNPSELIKWFDRIAKHPEKNDTRRLALLTCALRWAQFTLQFHHNEEQLLSLLGSKVCAANWIGLSILDSHLRKGGDINIIERPHNLYGDKKTFSLYWLLNEGNHYSSEFQELIIEKITESSPDNITSDFFSKLLDLLRDNCGDLHHSTTWILESLLLEMIQKNKVSIQQVALAWTNELVRNWNNALEGQHLSFRVPAEGAFSDELVLMFEYLDSSTQKKISDYLRKAFDACARVVRQPFGQEINCSKYLKAHQTNLWIYALSERLALIYSDSKHLFEALSNDSKVIIDRRSKHDWELFGNETLVRYAMTDPAQLHRSPLKYKLSLACAAQ